MKAPSNQSKLPNQFVQYLVSRINRKWMLWLAGLLFTVGTGFALYQPVNPDPWQVPTGWEKFIYPHETNAFLRQASISQAINDVVSVGNQLWAVGDGGLILHSSNGGLCWIAQGPWAQTAGPGTCAPQQTGLQRIFSGLSALQDRQLLDDYSFPAYAADAPAAPTLLEKKASKTANPPATDYNAKLPQQTELKTPTRAILECGGLNQRPCSAKERVLPCDAGLLPDNTGNRCIPSAQNQLNADNPLTSGAIPNLRAVAFFNQSKGIAVGDYGVILLTQDSGAHWQLLSNITRATLYAIVMLDQQTIMLGGSNGAMLRSTDQGLSWQSVASDTSLRVETFFTTADKQLFALAVDEVGKTTTILQSANAGSRWSAARKPLNMALRDIVTLNSNQWVATINDGNIVLSTDAGNSWKRTHHESGVTLNAIIQQKNNQLIVGGSNGSLLRSADNAQSWTRIDTATSANLTSLTMLDDNRLVAVGSSGTIMISNDLGQSWTSVTRGSRGELSAIASLDSKRIMAVGRDGVVLYSLDGGQNWMPGAQATQTRLLSITAADNSSYLAVGEKGSILRLTATGELLDQPSSNINVRLYAITSIGRNRFLTVGDSGTILASDDGGKQWNNMESGVKTSLQAISSLDENRILIVGQQGLVIRSDDAGISWSRAEFTGKDWLLSVARIDSSNLIATGYNGLILHSSDAGARWSTVGSGGKYWLNSVAVLSPRQFVAVGTGGTILRSEDGGDSWTTIPAGTTNNLNSITRLDNNRLLVAGSGGVLLRSLDGGRSWLAVDRYSAALANWWYLLVLVTIGLVLFVVWPRVEPAEDEGIAGLAASDRPLQPGDPDALNLSGIASDITTFLSNPKTTAPLTMAITGPWGSGKSSLMNLVRADLRARGFSPVWFNAWHHQKGEQLLASLFAHIKKQAIPSWFSFDGLWFRLKLAVIRGRRHWFIFAIMLALLFLTLSFNKQELTSLFLKLSLLSDPKLWWQVPWQEWTPSLKLLFQSGDWIQTMASLFGIGTPLIALLRSIRGFGISPKRLLSIDQARDSKGGYDPGARARFASEFRDVTRALGDNKMVIFIDDLDRCSQANLIDILENINFIASSGDCFMLLGMAPRYIEACVANHYETLARSIAEKEKHESRNHSEDLETHKFRFAHNYLEKMINIEITIPQMQPNSIDLLFNPTQQDQPKRRWQSIFTSSARSLSHALNIIIPITFILLAIGSGWEYGRKIPNRPEPEPVPVYDLWPLDQATLISLAAQDDAARITQQLVQQSTQANEDQTAQNPAATTYSIAVRARQQQLKDGIRLGSIGQGDNKADILLRLNQETGKPVAQVVTTQQAESATSANIDQTSSGIAAELRQQTSETGSRISALWLMFGVLMFASFAFYLYRKKTEKYAEDSDDFKAALSLWTPWIQLKQETPRAVKRFLNHLRFLAIRNHREMHESLLVAMATIYFYNSQWLLDEEKFKAICEGELLPLLKSDYRLDEQDKEQQQQMHALLENLSQRLTSVLKQIDIENLCKYRDQAISILGGALPIEQEEDREQQGAYPQSAQMKV